LKALIQHLKLKREIIIIAFVVSVFSPITSTFYQKLGVEYIKPLLVVTLVWSLSFIFLITLLDFIIEFFTLFLPNALRLKCPVSWVYKLRYEQGFNDQTIKMFGTKEWDELIVKIKSQTEHVETEV